MPINPKAVAEQDRDVLNRYLSTTSNTQAAGILKRCAVVIGSGSLVLSDKRGRFLGRAQDLGWPIGSYLAGHGGRVMLQLPPGDDGKLFKWLISGDQSGDLPTRKSPMKSGESYNRYAATHDAKIHDEDVIELKGLKYGVRDYLKSKFFETSARVVPSLLTYSQTKHYGVDMGIDHIDKSMPPGHLYFHYKPATSTQPGSIMLGMEGYPPDDHRHSKLGAADKFSTTAGPKWQGIMPDVKGYPLPAVYNGQKMILNQELINRLCTVSTDRIGPDIVNRVPTGNLESFTGRGDGGIQIISEGPLDLNNFREKVKSKIDALVFDATKPKLFVRDVMKVVTQELHNLKQWPALNRREQSEVERATIVGAYQALELKRCSSTVKEMVAEKFIDKFIRPEVERVKPTLAKLGGAIGIPMASRAITTGIMGYVSHWVRVGAIPSLYTVSRSFLMPIIWLGLFVPRVASCFATLWRGAPTEQSQAVAKRMITDLIHDAYKIGSAELTKDVAPSIVAGVETKFTGMDKETIKSTAIDAVLSLDLNNKQEEKQIIYAIKSVTPGLFSRVANQVLGLNLGGRNGIA